MVLCIALYRIQKYKEFHFQPHLSFSDLLPATRLTCIGPISLHTPLQLLAQLSCPNPGLWQRPRPVIHLLSSRAYIIHVSPTMTLVKLSSLAPHWSSWTTSFPHLSSSSTHLTLQILQASLLLFHLPLPQMASSTPTPLPSLPPWRTVPVNPGTAYFSIPLSPNRFLQMLCTLWVRQEGHQ